MTGDPSGDLEPSAEATDEAQSRFLRLNALFLAGPVIWALHFTGVYLLAEVLCHVEDEPRVWGAPAVSVLIVATTIAAVVATAAATVVSYRRWRAAGGGNPAAPDPALATGSEPDAELALAGFLLGILFIVVILFVGVPALVLEPC